jgi:serine phosphatase RsbU (regulator of sigma subunit)
LTESRSSDGEEFGLDRLMNIAVSACSNSAEGIKSAILQEIRNYTGNTSYGDDMTLVVVKIP